MISAAPLLPMSWVNKIFHTLTVLHGREFLGRWEGIPIEDVKADWAERLGCFFTRPKAIEYALDNLPDNKPPTVLEFRAVCLRCPAPVLPALTAPTADPDRVAAEFAKMATTAPSPAPGRIDHKAWARVIVKKHDDGIKVNPGPLRMARQALGLEK